MFKVPPIRLEFTYTPDAFHAWQGCRDTENHFVGEIIGDPPGLTEDDVKRMFPPCDSSLSSP